MAELSARWAAVAGDSPASSELGAELLRRWSEPHRRYHTTTHLAACLDAVDVLADLADDVRAVRLAVWFHDAVHDGRPGADEAASAALAEQRLPALGLAPAEVAEVARLVRLTAGHDPAPGDADGAVLCDADLSVLAGEPDAYAAYAAAVRAEYAHVPDDAFAHGRREVLEALLSRAPLYRTAVGRERWEDRARRNVNTELLLLG
jgi:predicted metal-dependent HD superfamily phosphohydrolase